MFEMQPLALLLLMFAVFMTGYTLAYREYCPRCGGRDTYRWMGCNWVWRCRACERQTP